MESKLALIEAIAPDVINIVSQRYRILQYVNWMGPIGRRTLASHLQTSERTIRTETDFLKLLGLIDISKSGMTLTQEGFDVYESLSGLMNQLLGVSHEEKKLSHYLGIDRCLIVSGDSDDQPRVLSELGKIVNSALSFLLPPGRDIISVMGGSTLAAVADYLTPQLRVKRDLTFVAARGGVGEATDIQASAIASKMAERTGGKKRTLYIPENLSQATNQSLAQEPEIKNVLRLIDKSQTVIHSVGRADLMVKRRHMSHDVKQVLKERGAVAEAFGCFFNQEGEVVYKIPRIGLQIQDLNDKPYIVAVAAGHEKAQAIAAYMHRAPRQTWLITDQGAANQILKGVTL